MYHGRLGEAATEGTVSAFQEFKVSQWRRFYKHVALRVMIKLNTGCRGSAEEEHLTKGRGW